ncbi:hypothetical protein VPNG_01706 [Cytospora leucostoma]|uniref:Uncharacterized protein n=1 Tax=Cytospora leucostoma TaxID=1230097 RepID=A0A423XKG0_9PEZI|nr:hypothetical protein VPNG_01706 [Cytospora leucostoma]
MSTMLYPCGPLPEPSTPPPPSYSAVNNSRFNSRPSHASAVTLIDNRHNISFAQWVRGLFRTNNNTKNNKNNNNDNNNNNSQPEPQDESLLQTQDLEITVHDTTPNITEVVAVTCDERRRKVTVDVKVSASVTARRRRHAAGPGGRPAAVVAPTKWLVKRTAQAKFSKPKGKGGGASSRSVAMATEKATRDAAEEAHRRAVALATMNAAAKALGEVAAQARGV